MQFYVPEFFLILSQLCKTENKVRKAIRADYVGLYNHDWINHMNISLKYLEDEWQLWLGVIAHCSPCPKMPQQAICRDDFVVVLLSKPLLMMIMTTTTSRGKSKALEFCSLQKWFIDCSSSHCCIPWFISSSAVIFSSESRRWEIWNECYANTVFSSDD